MNEAAALDVKEYYQIDKLRSEVVAVHPISCGHGVMFLFSSDSMEDICADARVILPILDGERRQKIIETIEEMENEIK